MPLMPNLLNVPPKPPSNRTLREMLRVALALHTKHWTEPDTDVMHWSGEPDADVIQVENVYVEANQDVAGTITIFISGRLGRVLTEIYTPERGDDHD